MYILFFKNSVKNIKRTWFIFGLSRRCFSRPSPNSSSSEFPGVAFPLGKSDLPNQHEAKPKPKPPRPRLSGLLLRISPAAPAAAAPAARGGGVQSSPPSRSSSWGRSEFENGEAHDWWSHSTTCHSLNIVKSQVNVPVSVKNPKIPWKIRSSLWTFLQKHDYCVRGRA